MQFLETRTHLLDKCLKNGIVCEIGVFRGEFAQDILQRVSPLKLHLIDIFSGMMGSGDKDGNNMIYVDLDQEYRRLIKLYENDERVSLHRGYSHDILINFPDNHFDMIYIDADHSYSAVKSDLNIALQKIKKGGLLAGHDYNINEHPGVVQAVQEITKSHGKSINYLTRDGMPSFGIIC